ncbi:hypothetical protein C2S51_026462 [Perilla frutescens var. frutescens]|nr:hypothetical protein C2S51_026462 [Perilla frutescens var. frutescens]
MGNINTRTIVIFILNLLLISTCVLPWMGVEAMEDQQGRALISSRKLLQHECLHTGPCVNGQCPPSYACGAGNLCYCV